jgi:hypothetical protein
VTAAEEEWLVAGQSRWRKYRNFIILICPGLDLQMGSAMLPLLVKAI